MSYSGRCRCSSLPFGVKTADEAGVARIPGQAESAPHEFRAGRIALRVTIVATVLWGLFLLNYLYGWVSADALNFANLD
jgi:predicted secreted protein